MFFKDERGMLVFYDVSPYLRSFEKLHVVGKRVKLKHLH